MPWPQAWPGHGAVSIRPTWENRPCRFSSDGDSRVWRWSWRRGGPTARSHSPSTRPDGPRPGRSTSIKSRWSASSDKGEPVGKNGVYISGDTPASTKFVTGRFVLAPGKTPHAPHTHAEEEVMIIESGQRRDLLRRQDDQDRTRLGDVHDPERSTRHHQHRQRADRLLLREVGKPEIAIVAGVCDLRSGHCSRGL